MHTTTPAALNVWPKSLEAQLNYKNAGDIWVIGTSCEIDNPDKRGTGVIISVLATAVLIIGSLVGAIMALV